MMMEMKTMMTERKRLRRKKKRKGMPTGKIKVS